VPDRAGRLHPLEVAERRQVPRCLAGGACQLDRERFLGRHRPLGERRQQRRAGPTSSARTAALLLAILDQTIVSSAAAPIVRDLHPAGGAGQIPWLIAAYTLASTCVQPLYGKLADRLGARAVFLTTVALFLAGSALCAGADSVGELIAFRAVQGLGGGGLMSVTIVALAHLRQARGDAGNAANQGNNLAAATLVGIGLVLGPTVGGQIVEHLSWRWVLLINLPLGGVAWMAAWACMRLPVPGDRTSLDLPGSALLAIAAGCLLLGCQWGGHQYAWRAWPVLALGAGGLAAVATFVVRQLRAAEPLFPVRVVTMHNVRAIALLQLLVGIGMTGGAVYMTIELQLVHQISPAATGVRLLPMAAGLAIGALVGRRLLARLETLTRAIALGSLLSATAFAALATIGGDQAAAASAIKPVFGICAGVMGLAAVVALAMPLRANGDPRARPAARPAACPREPVRPVGRAQTYDPLRRALE
jgi:MFS family permease